MARDAETTSPSLTSVTTSLTAELIFAANQAASLPGIRSGIDPDWVARQRAQMGPEALERANRLSGFWWPTLGLVDFFCWNGAFHDPEAFLSHLESTPLETFLPILLNGDITPDQARAFMADPASARPLSGRVSRFSDGTPAALEALFREPEAHRQDLIALVRAADTPLVREGFVRMVRETEPTVRTLERRLASEDPLAVAESLRNKPVGGPAPFREITFVPSRLIGHRHIQSWGDGRAVFFLQDGAVALNGPTQEGSDLADFLKVLGDKTRMDILRLLCCGPSYGKEIAASLGLTTATVSRHLDQLKAAGLVREDRADANNVKRLSYVPEALETELDRLRTYLLHP